jgi:uncharacterized membrane protein YoaK (UPF0700 family)
VVWVLAVVLTVGTGATDVASFTRLGEVFASVMTGNLVLLGFAAERLSGALAVHALVAFAGYVLGVAIGSRLTTARTAGGATAAAGRAGGGTAAAGTAAAGTAGTDRGGEWHRAVLAGLLVELALLAAFAVGWELAGAAPGGAGQLALLAAATAAMGTQSVAARHLGGPAGGPVSTTYLTGTLTGAVAALVTPGQRARVQTRELSLLAALAAGAAGGGLLLATAPAWLPAIPLASLVAVISVVGILRRGKPVQIRWRMWLRIRRRRPARKPGRRSGKPGWLRRRT